MIPKTAILIPTPTLTRILILIVLIVLIVVIIILILFIRLMRGESKGEVRLIIKHAPMRKIAEEFKGITGGISQELEMTPPQYPTIYLDI